MTGTASAARISRTIAISAKRYDWSRGGSPAAPITS